MLCDNEIRDAIKAKRIMMSYAWLPDGAGSFKYYDPAAKVDSHSDATSFLEAKLSRERVGLTVGRLVSPLSGDVPRGLRFFNHRRVFDLEKAPDRCYPLRPGESAVLITNEWICLDKSLCAVILPRVKGYCGGLFVSTSYVSSLWKGILFLHVTNTSAETRAIGLGHDIAKMFFFTNGVNPSEEDKVSDALHYNLAWHRILTEQHDPFIRRGQANDGEGQIAQAWRRLKVFFHGTQGVMNALGVSGGALILALGVGGYRTWQQTEGFEDRLKRIESHVAEENEQGRSDFQYGRGEIEVQSGSQEGTAVWRVSGSKHRDAQIWTSLVDGGSQEVAALTGTLERAGSDLSVRIRVKLRMQADGAKAIAVQWVVLSRW